MILLLEYLYIFINMLSTTGEFLQTFTVINFISDVKPEGIQHTNDKGITKAEGVGKKDRVIRY